MNTEKSQNERIKNHLEKGGKITAYEALAKFGCLRLSGRIYDLTHDHNMNIVSRRIKVGKKYVAQYSLSE